MSDTVIYHTTVTWRGEHLGHLALGNGPEMDFSAPPQAHGQAGLLTPEDAFVGAANTCLMLMFLWSAERLRLKLISYDCRAEGQREVDLDRTESFTCLSFYPSICISAGERTVEEAEAAVRRALRTARKYSLVLNSVKSEIVIEPKISVK